MYIFFSPPALALCDMNTVQKKRINLARSVLMFRTGESHSYEKFEENVISEMPTLTDEVIIFTAFNIDNTNLFICNICRIIIRERKSHISNYEFCLSRSTKSSTNQFQPKNFSHTAP